ncbi:MAG: DUF615 domain-containing protein [Myxococcota bacterium]|nr:DUF615 domain-containing protein [Myxococcota bacterium]
MARKKFQWSREDDDPEGEVHFTERTPRNEMRRRKNRINALGKELVRMSDSQLREMALDPGLSEAVAEARRLVAKGNVKGGMKRQMLYLSAVLRGIDDETLERLFDDAAQLSRRG